MITNRKIYYAYVIKDLVIRIYKGTIHIQLNTLYIQLQQYHITSILQYILFPKNFKHQKCSRVRNIYDSLAKIVGQICSLAHEAYCFWTDSDKERTYILFLCLI